MTAHPRRADHAERIVRARLSLAGLSVGDAFGQTFFFREAWASGPHFRQTAPPPWRYTDDTEMALALVSVLDRHEEVDQDALAEAFAARYARDPHRGYGATAHNVLQAIGQGVPWRTASQGAFDGAGSMGNGSAMRVAPLGAYFADDLSTVASQAARSAEVTHLHPEGIAGGIATAIAAAWAWNWNHTGRREPPAALFDAVLAMTPAGATRTKIEEAAALPPGTWEFDAARELGNGSRVICSDTVPFCLWTAARHLGDYREALWTAVKTGGDLDTNAAIIGGIVALTTDERGIPPEWLAAREPLS